MPTPRSPTRSKPLATPSACARTEPRRRPARPASGRTTAESLAKLADDRPSPSAVQRFSTTLFALILCFSLILVGWWTWLQMNASAALQSASEQLARGEADAAAKALGADGARGLAQLAAR